MRRSIGVAILGASLISLASCQKSIPPDVAAMVNNKSITFAEIDRQYQAQFGQPPKAGDDQATLQRLEVLRSLIDNEIMWQRAEKLNLLATEADVDARYNELKAPFTQEELQRQLKERNMTEEEVKTQLRRDLSLQRLFNREITSKITITDKEISDYYTANRAMFNQAEPQIHISQILVTGRDGPVRNLKNDKAKTPEQARQKMEMIRRRIEAKEDFAMLAQNYSEDPDSAQNGGDVGFIPESALGKLPPEIRRAILTTEPGKVTPVIPAPDGYRVFRVLGREPQGQRELNDPTVQQRIRELLLNRKDQLLKSAYYEVARNEARVVNQLALSIAPASPKK